MMDKRQRERRYFDLFLESRPELQGGTIAQPAPPAPDIAYSLGTRVVGVELTEMHARESIRQVEGEQSETLLRAQRLYESSSTPLVSVSVCWSASFTADKRLRETRAREVADLVAAHVPPSGHHVGLGAEPDGLPLAHPLLDAMWIERIVDYQAGENVWSSEYDWWGSAADEGFVQKHIDRKQGKRASYPPAFTDAWLLLTVRGTKPSSGFSVSATALSCAYSSDFDRVFIFETLRGVSHELRVAAAT